MLLPLLSFNSVSFSYGMDRFALKNIRLNINNGDFYSVIGRNGSGKSTLVNLVSGISVNYEGSIMFAGSDIKTISRKLIAKHISFIPQQARFFDTNIRVSDFLSLGRYPYKSLSEFGSTNDEKEIIESAIEYLSLQELKDKYIYRLSGGERQKVILALALVQLDCRSDLSGKLLVTDEPLTFLDVSHQYEIFNVLAKLNKDLNLTLITVIHDLNMALKYTNKTVLLEKGEIVSSGNTLEIITQESLEKYFMIKSQILNFENEYHVNFLPN